MVVRVEPELTTGPPERLPPPMSSKSRTSLRNCSLSMLVLVFSCRWRV